MYRSRVGMDAQKPGLARELHKAKFRAHHEKRLEEISRRAPGTGTVDNTPPYTANLAHLKTRPKKKAILAARDAEVERANRELLRQMTKIFTTPSELLPVASSATEGRGEGLGPCLSINVLCRKRELERIATENKTWAKHLKEVSPSYNVDAWERDHRANKKVMGRLRTVRYTREKTNPEEYSRRGVRRLRKQVERTRGQAFEAGYSTLLHEFGRKSSVGKYSDSSGKSHRQPKKRPKSLSSSASSTGEHGFPVGDVGNDDFRESDGKKRRISGSEDGTTETSQQQLNQAALGETVGTESGCFAERVGFSGTRAGTQQKLPLLSKKSGSRDHEVNSRNQTEEAVETSGDGDESQAAYSEFDNDDGDEELADQEGEKEYSDFEDASEEEGQEADQYSEFEDEASTRDPDLPNTGHCDNSDKDLVEAGAASPALSADEEKIRRGKVDSSRELEGTRTQETVGFEANDNAEAQSSSEGIEKAPEEEMPSPDDGKGPGDNSDSSCEDEHTRERESGAEGGYRNASFEEGDQYTSESEAPCPAADAKTTTTTSPAVSMPSPPAKSSESPSSVSETPVGSTSPVSAPNTMASEKEPTATSEASVGSPAATGDTRDSGDVADCSSITPLEARSLPPENREQPAHEMPTPDNHPQSVSYIATDEGNASVEGEDNLLTSAAPLAGQEVEGVRVPACSSPETSAMGVQSDPDKGPESDCELGGMLEEKGQVIAGATETDGGSESATIEVPPLEDSTSLSQATPSGVEKPGAGTFGADQAPTTLMRTPPTALNPVGGQDSIGGDSDLEQIRSPNAPMNQGESTLGQPAPPSGFPKEDSITTGKEDAEPSSVSNKAGGNKVDEASVRRGEEPAATSAVPSSEQAPEEEPRSMSLSALPPPEDSSPPPCVAAAAVEKAADPQAMEDHGRIENSSDISTSGPAREGLESCLFATAGESGVITAGGNPVEVAEAAVMASEADKNGPDNSGKNARPPLVQTASIHDVSVEDTGNTDSEVATMVGRGSSLPLAVPSDQSRLELSRVTNTNDLEHDGGESTEWVTDVAEGTGSVASATKDESLVEDCTAQKRIRAEDSPRPLPSQKSEVNPSNAPERGFSAGRADERPLDGEHNFVPKQEATESEIVPDNVIANEHHRTRVEDAEDAGDTRIRGIGTEIRGEIESAPGTGAATVEIGPLDTGGSDELDPLPSVTAMQTSRSVGDVSDVSDVGIDPPLITAEAGSLQSCEGEPVKITR